MRAHVFGGVTSAVQVSVGAESKAIDDFLQHNSGGVVGHIIHEEMFHILSLSYGVVYY